MNYTKPCHGNWACSPCGWNLKIRTCSSQGLPGGQLAHFTFVSGRNTESRVGESDEQASDMVSRTFLMMRRREPWCEQCRTYQPQSQVVVLSSVCSRSGNRAHVSLAHSASLSRLERSWFPAKSCLVTPLWVPNVENQKVTTIFLTLPRWREPPPSPPRGLPPTMPTAQAARSLQWPEQQLRLTGSKQEWNSLPLLPRVIAIKAYALV